MTNLQSAMTHQNVESLAGVVGVLLLLDGDHPQIRRRVLVVEREVGDSGRWVYNMATFL